MHRRPTILLSSCGLLAFAAIASPDPVAACSCTAPTFEQEFTNAKAVFSGRVQSITLVDDGNILVEFEPLARWKGGLGASVPVTTSGDAAGCGYPFELDREYLVFAFGGSGADPMFVTYSCSLTSPLADNPLLSRLGSPLLPTGTRLPTWGALKRYYR